MDIRPIKGNTWVLEGMEWIPFYKLDERRCILLDTGLLGEREELEQALLDHGLTPAGILCSHAHVDHGGNNRYFQEKYQIPVALTAKEAGMCAGLLNLKCYFLMLPPGMVERGSGWGHPGRGPPGAVRRTAADGGAGGEAQVGERAARPHVPEDPLVGVVGAADLAGLDPADVAGVAGHVLADLAGGPADGHGELAG